MNQILADGLSVKTESSATTLEVKHLLGSGGQGEVYRADLAGKPMALKWYFERYLQVDPHLRMRLQTAIDSGPPSDRFLWPMELASARGVPGFGYVMPLRAARFKGIIDVLRRRVDSSFRALATAGFEMADSFLQLHARGLCYRDISFGNVFFDPGTGEVRVCDNDNVDVNGQPGAITGTPGFMAPEVVDGEAMPARETDLFSLSVLLFYMFMFSHPLHGKKEADIDCLDLPAMRKLYGTEAVFIFDPHDQSNAPVPERHSNALTMWPIYPQFLRDRFTKAFTVGISDPKDGRIRETEWRASMVRLRDCIVYCSACAAENFYDERGTPEGSPNGRRLCWACTKVFRLPPRLRIGKKVLMLNHDTKLYPYHVDSVNTYDFSAPVGEVARHPSDPDLWGLRNLTKQTWVVGLSDGTVREVEPGRSVTLALGAKIQFGKAEGEIV